MMFGEMSIDIEEEDRRKGISLPGFLLGKEKHLYCKYFCGV